MPLMRKYPFVEEFEGNIVWKLAENSVLLCIELYFSPTLKGLVTFSYFCATFIHSPHNLPWIIILSSLS
jgi:hypothetical protein